MTELLDLPVEILEQIATHECLSLQDICRLSLTCRRLHSLVEVSWSLIANSRWIWPTECMGSCNEEWFDLVRQRHQCEQRLQRLFESTIKKGVRLYLTDDDEMEIYQQIIGEVCSAKVLICILKEILQKPIKSANLSFQYYGLTLYEFVKRQELREEWKKLLSRQMEDQLLIEAATLISLWINPRNDVTNESIMNEIKQIAGEVARFILQLNVSTDIDLMLSNVQKLNLPRDQILYAINKILFKHLKFGPAVNDYYDLDNSLIDKVLQRRRGIPITLSAIYQAVAYLFHVKTFPVNFPGHFLLKAPQNMNSGDGEVFIDVYGGGNLLNQEQCLGLAPFLTIPQPEMFNQVEPHKAMIRMVANIYCRGQFLGLNFDIGRLWIENENKWGPLVLPSALSLQLTLCNISPTSDYTRQAASEAADIAIDLRFNDKQVISVLSEMLADGSNIHILSKLQRAQTVSEKKKRSLSEPTRVKLRDPKKVWFTIGMIMKHRRYNYRCVIYGWDTRCEMSDSWILQMGVHHLPLGPDQPFYNVLVEDGTNRYAAQENLFHCPSQEMYPIKHWEIGKYFQAFKGDRYVPNHALLEKYPELKE